MASRKEAKEEARRQRLAEEQARAAEAQRARRMQTLAGIVLVAIAVVVVAIAISSGAGSKGGPPSTPAGKLKLKRTVSTLLDGIPQTGTQLGDPSAKVTMTYFGDLECPVCADFTTGANGGGFAQAVQDLVRPGKVKVVYRSFCTATCGAEDQDVFNTQQGDAYSAGLQKKFWYYAEFFYREQGAEGSGYVTPKFLDEMAEQVPGLDYASWQTDQNNPTVVSQVQSDQHLASKDGVQGTPTVFFSGPKGREDAGSGALTYSELLSAYDKVA